MKRLRGQRGGAAVETAISMIFIIPIFMYALFLDDLLRYRLDLQEAVLSSPWDLTTQDWTKAVSTWDIQHFARLMYCDHESGLDSFAGSSPPDCSEEGHHTSTISHVCWLGMGKQITLEGPNTGVGACTDSLFAKFRDEHHPGGGMFTSSGIESVENYLLPEKFLQDDEGGFSKVKMTKANWKGGEDDDEGQGGGSIHGNAQAGTESNAYKFEEERFALLVDPWALNTDQVREPDDKGTGPLYDRMKTVYTGTFAYSAFQGTATAFILSTYAELLSPLAPGPSEVTEPNLSITTSMAPTQNIDQEGSGESYFNVPWKDWESDQSKDTQQDRKNFYMGCPDGSESC